MCVDYRKLNDVTIKDRTPLPRIDETFDRLGEAAVFSKFDLEEAYYLIRIAEGDQWKTAFRTCYGHYEYEVMPFGLTGAPASFQALMNETLREYIDKFVAVYIDDIVIYSKTIEEHRGHIKMVLTKLREAHLKLKLSKCEFHKKEIEFLGYVVGQEGMKMDQKKVQAIEEWKVPKSL
jgi:hypothetical protein